MTNRARVFLSLTVGALTACSTADSSPLARVGALAWSPRAADEPGAAASKAPTGAGAARSRSPRASAPAVPAAPPSQGGAGAGGAADGLGCETLLPKATLDRALGVSAEIVTAAEPPLREGSAVRCERRVAELDQHFAYYVHCGRSAAKAFTTLKKQLKKLARVRRGREWKSAFAAPGTFAFLTRSKDCYAQVAGRLLVARPELGAELGSLLAQHLRD